GPGAAPVVRLTGGPASSAISRLGRHVKILVVATGAINGKFDRAFAWLRHAGAADARNAAFILRARWHAVLQPAGRDRTLGLWVDKCPRMAARITLAPSGAHRRITAANLEF